MKNLLLAATALLAISGSAFAGALDVGPGYAEGYGMQSERGMVDTFSANAQASQEQVTRQCMGTNTQRETFCDVQNEM